MSSYTLNDLLPQTYLLEIKVPGNPELTGLHLELVGQDTANFKKYAKIIAQKSINMQKGKEELDIVKFEADNQRLVAACIVGWDCPEVFGEYSEKAALELVQHPGLSWLVEQVEAAVKERENFFRGNKKPAE